MTVFLTLAAVMLMVWAAFVLTRTLPAQNAAFILGFLLLAELALEMVPHQAGRAGFPGPDLLFFPAMVVLTRAGWRWLLRRRRTDWNYGIRLILLTGAGAALLQCMVGFATRPAATRFLATTVCLLVLSPWFISKFPKQPQNHAQ